MIDPVQLSGPAQRIEQGIGNLRAGKVIISGESPRTAQLMDALESTLPNYGFEPVLLGAGHDFEFAASALEVDSASDPGRLLQAPRLNNIVLRVDCRAPAWMNWARSFLTKLSSTNLVQTLKLWLVWPDATPRPTHRLLASLDWKGCLSPGDVRIFAADRFRDRQGPGPTNYWECLAAEIGGPDLDLIERMAAASAPIYDPVRWLIEDSSPAVAPEPFDGTASFESSIMLARRAGQDPRAAEVLHRRIWSAQVRSLFVALEAERPGVLAPFKSQLELSYRQRPPSEYEAIESIPRDVEWGAAQFRLSREAAVPAPVRRLLDVAKRARNHLAHGEAMEASLMQELLDACGPALRGRWANR